jgi:DNA-binding SARP family transcriptional activator
MTPETQRCTSDQRRHVIRLTTLGDTLIHVGEHDLRPSSPTLFALLLYLAMERGRRIPRTQLQALLMPDQDNAGHALRQLLYRARRIGAPIEMEDETVTVTAGRVDWDVDVVERESAAMGATGVFLPDYEPRLSGDYARWLDDTRDRVGARIVKVLLKRLAHARGRADHERQQGIAVALLQIDAYNEEATLARAEGLALAGQKARAVRVLSEYSSEVGKLSGELTLQPDMLKRRLTDVLEVQETQGLSGAARAMAAMIPQLLRKRGALGVAPETLAYLRKVERGEASWAPGALRAAWSELVLSVAEEGPLVLVLDGSSRGDWNTGGLEPTLMHQAVSNLA